MKALSIARVKCRSSWRWNCRKSFFECNIKGRHGSPETGEKCTDSCTWILIHGKMKKRRTGFEHGSQQVQMVEDGQDGSGRDKHYQPAGSWRRRRGEHHPVYTYKVINHLSPGVFLGGGDLMLQQIEDCSRYAQVSLKQSRVTPSDKFKQSEDDSLLYTPLWKGSATPDTRMWPIPFTASRRQGRRMWWKIKTSPLTSGLTSNWEVFSVNKQQRHGSATRKLVPFPPPRLHNPVIVNSGYSLRDACRVTGVLQWLIVLKIRAD